MNPKYLFLICGFLFVYFHSKAQFEGQGSFSSDTLLRANLRTNRVSSVVETIRQNGVTTSVGHIYFDPQARVVEITNPYRMKLEYNENGKVTKRTMYNTKDTSKADFWMRYNFDANGRLLSEEYGQYQGDKLTVSKKTGSKITREEKGLVRMETYTYFGDKVVSTTYSLDSVSGIYKFGIQTTYESMSAFYGLPEQGEQVGKKTLSRSYVINNCQYEDKIEYEVNSNVEHAKNIETTYHQRDEKGRILEQGKIESDEAYEKYLEAHPGDASNDYFSPVFVRSFLEGKVQGQKTMYTNYTYSAKGLLVEKKHYGSNYIFKYNEKDQLTELICEGYHAHTVQYWYNDKGLVIRMLSTPGKQESGSLQSEPKECTYVYTYY